MIGRVIKIKLEESLNKLEYSEYSDNFHVFYSSYFKSGTLYTNRFNLQRMSMLSGEKRELTDQSKFISHLYSTNHLVQRVTHEFHRIIEGEIITVKLSIIWRGERVPPTIKTTPSADDKNIQGEPSSPSSRLVPDPTYHLIQLAHILYIAISGEHYVNLPHPVLTKN
jgi:hypothetical protein